MAEQQFAETSTLISITDLQGVIQYCNRDFINISGYSENELIGANHNIVRHADMPKAAFADLWETVKAGKPWQGMVKNRCKNGDYYWVDAYVTPVFEEGKKVGYQSVRSCPTRKQVVDAENLYRKMNQSPGMALPKPHPLLNVSMQARVNLMLALILLLMVAVQIESGSLMQASVTTVVLNILGLGLFARLFSVFNMDCLGRMKRMTDSLRRISTGDLTENIKITRQDELGEAVASTKMLQGRLKAVLGKFAESLQDLSVATDTLSDTSFQTRASMNQQHSQTDLVATAMHEMSATVSEIAQNTVRTSELAGNADKAASTGRQLIGTTRTTITDLSEDISMVSESVNSLAKECSEIKDITQTISGISEQTNLLALNAAIEAARAGELGRGFAVVADEVRVLASRTQNSTVEIDAMIARLIEGSSQAVSAMETGLKRVEESVERIREADESFNLIVESVTDVNDMNTQIATAAEEQSSVAEEMNLNVQTISEQSYKTNASAEQLEEKIKSMREMAVQLQRQIDQYDFGESAATFDFEAAKAAHLAWKDKVRRLLQGEKGAIPKNQVCSHKECALGRWYYSDGQKSYGSVSSFKSIEAPHKRLHEIVREVYEENERGNSEKAESLYSELAPLSDEIVGLLEKTEKAVR